MNTKTRKIIAALFAVLVVSTGAAAAATFDTETTTTASESDVSGATNTALLDPGNASESLYVETDGAASSNLTLEISPAEAGVDTVVYSNSTPDTVNDTNGHYAFNVTHDELEDIPRDEAGGTYNVSVYNDSDTEILNTEVTFETTRDGDDNAIMWVTDGGEGSALTNLVADSVEISNKEAGLMFWAEDMDVSTWSGYTAVNGTNSTITVDFKNSTTTDAYSNTTSEDTEEGDWVREQTVWINGIPHKVYYESAPDEVDDDSTVVTYDEDADSLNVELGDEYENTRTVSIRATGGDGYAFGELWSNFGALDALASLY